MDISNRELWKAVDRVVFGTSDLDEIKKMLRAGLTEKERLEKSLGGFLFLLREGRGLTVPAVASQVGVEVEKWELWEGDVSSPTGFELSRIKKQLGLWRLHSERLLKLWHQSSFRSLCRVVAFRPRLLAARGVAAVTPQSQWSLLHPDAQERLTKWGRAHGYRLPDGLFELLRSLDLESEEEQVAWAREVWNFS